MPSEIPASTTPGSRRESRLLWALIALVALAPLPLASNRPLPAALLCLGAGLLMLAWSLHLARGGRVAVAPSLVAWPLALFGAVCVWILVQWLPLPLAGWGDPIWAAASAALGEPLAGRLTVNPEATLTSLMRLLAYGMVFWLALQLGRAPERAARALRAAVFIGAVYATYGVIVYLLGNERILHYPKWAYFNALTSTFVNRNSYATFAGLALICALPLLVDNVRRIMSFARPARQKFVLVIEYLAGDGRWAVMALLIIALALLLTASRAGVASTFAAILLLLFLLRGSARIGWRGTLVLLALPAALLALAFALGGAQLMERFARDDIWLNQVERSDIHDMTRAAIASAPWTGTGFGTYEDVAAGYRDGAIDLRYTLDKAHSSYLESAVELGLPAAAGLHLSILLLGWRAARGAFERKRNRALPAVGAAATLLVGLHALVDFSLQIPAVAVFYAFVLGFAVSQSWRSRDA